jgi:hypothetical protein
MDEADAITACAVKAQEAINELILIYGFTAYDAVTFVIDWFNQGRIDPTSASETITVGRILYG